MLLCSFGILNKISLLCQPQEEKTLYSMSVSRWFSNYTQMRFSITTLRHRGGEKGHAKIFTDITCSTFFKLSSNLCKIILLQNSLIRRVILIFVT